MLPWDATRRRCSSSRSRAQPWEAWSYEPYRALTTNDQRHGPLRRAGGRATHARARADRSELHAEHPLRQQVNFQLVGDLFNVTNTQTGYNFQQAAHDSAFGTPRNFYDPRRFQLAMRFQF